MVVIYRSSNDLASAVRVQARWFTWDKPEFPCHVPQMRDMDEVLGASSGCTRGRGLHLTNHLQAKGQL